MFKRIILILGVGVIGVGCGNTQDRPPPPPQEGPKPDVWHKVHCACQVPLSPAAQNYLGTSGPTISLNVDACEEEKNDATQMTADDTCTKKVAPYVRAELEQTLIWKIGPQLGAKAVCSDASGNAAFGLINGPVICTTTPYENAGANSSEFPAGRVGLKIEPACKDAYAKAPVSCDFTPTTGNCPLSVDPQEAFNPNTCRCDSVTGCTGTSARVKRPAVGNADDPPPAPAFDPQSPIADLALGRKDGIINDGKLKISVTARGCIDVLVGSICASDTARDESNLSGGFRVYGGPCVGSACNVALEGNLAAGRLHFNFGIDTPLGKVSFAEHSITDFIMFVGSGDISVPVDANGHGSIPPGAAQYRAFWRDNGAEKQSIGFFSEALGFDINWATKTLSVDQVTLNLGGSSATVSFDGTFGDSLFDRLGNLCPKPRLAQPVGALAVACGADTQVTFPVPGLALGCRDTPATVTGSVIAANGQTLATPIPIVNGAATVPRGELVVRWIATDTEGRTDQVDQVISAVTRPALAASNSLDLGDRFLVTEASGQWGAVSNTGSGLTVLNTDGRVGEFDSATRITLRDRAAVNLLVSRQVPERFNQTILLAQSFVTPVAFPQPALPTLTASNNDVFVESDTSRTLVPGAYGKVTVHPRGHLKLQAGDYAFRSLETDSQSVLDLNKANGSIRVVVYETTKLQATYNPTPNNATGFLLGYLGQQTVYVETQFRGTLVVPNASLNLRALNGVSHEGEFYAKDLKTEGGATVRHVPAACALP